MHEIDLEDYNHYRKIKFSTHQITISIDDLLLNRSSDSIGNRPRDESSTDA
ncbi:MAG: hypothetical protein Ct9H300mP18_01170 [Candidatus Neomarinimicrobiota bacterium]|nr:MAG: hypothetical protein Ct9H300mP18_01170 [Candidatus Neomarinimicrobiota bacterium]